MDKTRLRRQIQKRLLELTVEQRAEKSKRACSNLVLTPQFRDASTIMLYLSLPHEVATSDAILHAWQMGKTVAVPRISWQHDTATDTFPGDGVLYQRLRFAKSCCRHTQTAYRYRPGGGAGLGFRSPGQSARTRRLFLRPILRPSRTAGCEMRPCVRGTAD